MAKQAVFTMKIETELREAFMAEAEALHRPASQIIREMMREFIQHQHEEREYHEFLHHKVAMARHSMETQQSYSNDEVETKFATRRAKLKEVYKG